MTASDAGLTLEEWVAERSSRRVVHVDFGTSWTDPARPEHQHRVSWVPTTGELYVTDSVESSVKVLALIDSRARVDEVLAGWATVASQDRPLLAWVEDRVSGWRSEWGIGGPAGPSAGTEPPRR